MKVIVGSRESKLAVIQSEMVIDAVKAYDETIETELLTMKTTGDMILDKTLDQIGGKGLLSKSWIKRAGRKSRSDGAQFEGYAHGSIGEASSAGILKAGRSKGRFNSPRRAFCASGKSGDRLLQQTQNPAD